MNSSCGNDERLGRLRAVRCTRCCVPDGIFVVGDAVQQRRSHRGWPGQRTWPMALHREDRVLLPGLFGRRRCTAFRELHYHVRDVGSLGTGWQGNVTCMSRPPPGRARAVARPSPYPRPRRVRSVPSCRNGWNRSSTASGGTSVPVLPTETTAPAVVNAVEICTWPPSTLYRIALSRRLATRLPPGSGHRSPAIRLVQRAGGCHGAPLHPDG